MSKKETDVSRNIEIRLISVVGTRSFYSGFTMDDVLDPVSPGPLRVSLNVLLKKFSGELQVPKLKKGLEETIIHHL